MFRSCIIFKKLETQVLFFQLTAENSIFIYFIQSIGISSHRYTDGFSCL